jgi:hypothetical protein
MESVALPLFVLSELSLKRLEVGRVMAEQASRTTSGQNSQTRKTRKNRNYQKEKVFTPNLKSKGNIISPKMRKTKMRGRRD